MTIAILGGGKGDSCALDIGHININILNICTASTEHQNVQKSQNVLLLPGCHYGWVWHGALSAWQTFRDETSLKTG